MHLRKENKQSSYDCHKYIIYGYKNLTAKYLKGTFNENKIHYAIGKTLLQLIKSVVFVVVI